jgi:hypothetical protein
MSRFHENAGNSRLPSRSGLPTVGRLEKMAPRAAVSDRRWGASVGRTQLAGEPIDRLRGLASPMGRDLLAGGLDLVAPDLLKSARREFMRSGGRAARPPKFHEEGL